MAYAQLDVHFDEAIKYEGLSLGHFGLMACAISYCNRALTDGKVPASKVRAWGKGEGPKLVVELVERKIWQVIPEGYLVVGFLDHNPSKAEVEAKVTARKSRQADYYKRKRVSSDDSSTRRTRVNSDTSEGVVAGSARGSGSAVGSVSGGESREGQFPNPFFGPPVEAAFAEGVGDVTGKPYESPSRGEFRNLLRAVAKHSKLVGDDLAPWTREKVAAWMRTGPRKVNAFAFIEWLNTPASPVVSMVGMQLEAVYAAGIAKGRGAPYSCPPNTEALLRRTFQDQGYDADGVRLGEEDLEPWLAAEAETFARWLLAECQREPKMRTWYSDYGPKGFQKRMNEIGAAEAARTGAA